MMAFGVSFMFDASRRRRSRAGVDRQPGRDSAKHDQRHGEAGQRDAIAAQLIAETKQRRGDHRAHRIEAQYVAVQQTDPRAHQQIHHLLQDDEGRAAGDAEYRTVAQKQHRQAIGARRDLDPQRRAAGADHDQHAGGRHAIQRRREIHAHGEPDRR
jgi:hypothetical protein